MTETNTTTNNNTQKHEFKDINTWEELEDVNPQLLRGIYNYGFENPSPIQKKAICPIFAKKDIIAQAQSGTGKTGCFSIGALQRINCDNNTPQAIIISPTRELSLQTKGVIDGIGGVMKNLRTQLLVGGTSIDEDIRLLTQTPPHIIVGCPGRIHDMLKRKKLRSSDLRILIIDEADEMLSFGFKEQIYNIFQLMPNDIQVALFSATMPTEINNLTERFMRDPVKILVKAEQLTLDGINQYYVALENDEQKYDTLKDIYGMVSLSQCIIYCNSVKRVSDLYEAMQKDDFPVCQIHSSMDKEERTKSYQDFKSGKFRVLISSDVTARGIDVQQVSTVINFDIPSCIHTYLHRIGRSGRWGRKGVGINFITARDSKKIKELEQYYATTISELTENWANHMN